MNPLALQNAHFAPLFRDEGLADIFSTERISASFLAFEIALSKALGAEAGVLERMRSFEPDLSKLEPSVILNGVSVPEYVAQLRAHVGEGPVHSGATSQDVIDTAMMIAVRDANEVIAERLTEVVARLDDLEARFGTDPMMGRTRMQAAIVISVGDRLDAWRGPLAEALEALGHLRPLLERVQLGGPVGTGFRDQPGIRAQIAEALGLHPAPTAWHSTRGALMDYGSWLSRVSGSLGKLGLDLGLMAQQGVEEVAFQGGGASSAMPHKQNPVLAEVLVSFARYNAAQLAALHSAQMHEQERSGAAWTLEWMVLPAMIMTTGRGLALAADLLGQVERLGQAR
ncbi:MAG: 3-carboxy-cis,cis-muconate cycloisomerase [Pseudomonadota bacterium]